MSWRREKMKQRKKRYWIGGIVLLLIVVIIPFGLSVFIYEQNFGGRYTTPDELKYEVKEFEGLVQTPAFFESNKQQLLAGYIYTQEETSFPNGVIILAHGLGGGHNSYLPEIQFMTQNGYTVFAYDGTGTDESEGSSMKGMPQAIIDLDYAINYVKNDEQFDCLPIMLYGHSMGGYAVMAVLNEHEDITAVVERSGFDESIDMIVEAGGQMMGKGIKLLTPYVRFYEYLKFGHYATLSGVEGLGTTKAKVMLMHSEDDEVVSYQQNFAQYKHLFGANTNFTFVSYEGRGHDVVTNVELKQSIEKEIKAIYGSLESVPKEQLMAYNGVLYDIDQRLDSVVMRQIIEFYNQSVVKEYE